MSSPDVSIVSEELKRVLASTAFRTSGRSAKLLRFLVEETLAGRSDRLKDYTLGAEALGRGDSFDPRTDPIARVEASRLRSRLELYYATEGQANPVRITLPKGGYVPSFEERHATVADADAHGSTVSLPQGRARQALFRNALSLIGLTVVLGLFVVLLRSRPSIESAPEIRLTIETPPTTDPLYLALSPDGRYIAFVAVSDGRPKLWLRPMDSTTGAMPLKGTEGASFPFWKPDSRSIAFFAESLLKRLDIESGLVKPITRVAVPAGGAWNKDGIIIFPQVPNSPLFQVNENGGESRAVTKYLGDQNGHRAPQFLPDQRHFIYYAASQSPDSAVRGVYVGDLRDAQFSKQVIGNADTPAVYVTGHLLFLRQGTLFAQRFDADTLEVAGEPHPIAESVAWSSGTGIAALSVSDTGLIAYRTGHSGRRQFVWLDHDGNELERLGSPADFGPGYVSLSPKGHLLVTQQTVGGDTDIYMRPTHGSGGPVNLTTDHDTDIAPIFSPDGDRVAFASQDGRAFNLYEVDLTGSPKTEILITSQPKQPTDWAGDTLLFRSLDPEMDWDIWALNMETRRAVPVVRTEAEERDARFSPDMKWIAYQSKEFDRFEIYVQPYPGPGQKRKISENGGASVIWGPDHQLFYLALDGTLMEVQITLSPSGKDIESVSAPVRLFQANVNSVQDLRRRYAVSPDGKAFLVDTMVEEPVPPITVIVNWSPRP